MKIEITYFEKDLQYLDEFICQLQIDDNIITLYQITAYGYTFYHFCSDVGQEMNWKHWQMGLVPMGTLDPLREAYEYIDKHIKLYKVWQ